MKENKRKILSVLAVSAALLGGVCICKYNEQPEATVVPDAKAVAAEILGQRADRVSDGGFSASSVNAKCNELCRELGDLQAASSAVKMGFYDVTVQTAGNGCDKGADGKTVTLTADYGNKSRVWTSNLIYNSGTGKCTCTLKNVIGKYTISWVNANDETVRGEGSSNSRSQSVYAGDHSYTSSITTPSTCTAEGVRTFTCRHCGHSYTESVAAKGHDWNSGVVTTPPTCTADGKKTFTCSTCHGTRTENVAALGHNYVNHKCTRCSAWEEGWPKSIADMDPSVISGLTPDEIKSYLSDPNNPSPKEIQKIAQAGKAADIVSEDKLLQWYGNYYRVIGINKDTPCNKDYPYDPSVPAHKDVLTLLFLGAKNGSFWNGYGTAPMNDTNTNAGGWKASKMSSTTMSEFVNSIPDVKDFIGYVKKANTANNYGSGGESTADKAFLLSRDEVFNGRYSYFANTTTRNLNNGYWWLRSPNLGSSNGFYFVYQGSSYGGGATGSNGVFPAICIY